MSSGMALTNFHGGLKPRPDRTDVVPSVAAHVPTPKGVPGCPSALLASPQTTLSVSRSGAILAGARALSAPSQAPIPARWRDRLGRGRRVGGRHSPGLGLSGAPPGLDSIHNLVESAAIGLEQLLGQPLAGRGRGWAQDVAA